MHPPSGPAWAVWLETSGVGGGDAAVAVALSVGRDHAHRRLRRPRRLAPSCSTCACSGSRRALPVSAMAAHLLRWARLALLLVVPSGVLMFMAHATEFAASPAFQLKLLLIAAALPQRRHLPPLALPRRRRLGHRVHRAAPRPLAGVLSHRALDRRHHLRPPPRVFLAPRLQEPRAAEDAQMLETLGTPRREPWRPSITACFRERAVPSSCAALFAARGIVRSRARARAIACPLCGEGSATTLFEQRDFALGVPGRFPLVRCPALRAALSEPAHPHGPARPRVPGQLPAPHQGPRALARRAPPRPGGPARARAATRLSSSRSGRAPAGRAAARRRHRAADRQGVRAVGGPGAPARCRLRHGPLHGPDAVGRLDRLGNRDRPGSGGARAQGHPGRVPR